MVDNTETIATTKGSEQAKFRIGTLEYTKRGLFMLFVYLLWGDFCFTLMESVFPNVTPLTMSGLGSNNMLIGLVMTTIPNIFNAIVCPWVSFKSDRYRGKLGRRIPFLLYPTPFIALFLVLIGLSPDLGKFLFHTVLKTTHWSMAAITLTLIAVFSAGFQFVNMFVASVYYYLFNDVVPDEYLGRFMSAFRVVGVIAGSLFNFFIFPHAETHMKFIFIGAGCLYLVAFLQMCFKVKEGDYPPPPEYTDGQTGVIAGLKTYAKECFSHKFYWTFFVATAAYDLITAVRPFELLLQREALGLTPARIGPMLGAAGIATVILMIPAGYLSDKKHPLRMVLYAIFGLILVTPIRFIYLFHYFTPDVAFKVEFTIQMLLVPLGAMYGVSVLPMYMRILPPDRYGQFCSAQAMFRSVAMMLFGFLAGTYMDVMKGVCATHHARPNYYYGFAPLLTWVLQITSFVLLIQLYRQWKKFGGDESYVPPAVGTDASQVETEPAQA